ncbi:hypothetical protein L9F63_000056, partial [Diploptera punctata]
MHQDLNLLKEVSKNQHCSFRTGSVLKNILIYFKCIKNVLCLGAQCQGLIEQDFTPIVTATCKAGRMTINVKTNQSFF